MQGYSRWIQRLGSSPFNYWFGYVANASWVAYFLSRGTALTANALRPMAFFVHFAAGLLLWTFLEYLLHRYLYHVWPGALSHGHGLHHDSPRSLIGVPWWLTSVALYGLYRALAQLLPAGALGVEMGACWLGYIGYCLVHHGTHHWRMGGAYFRRVKRLHQLHHAFPSTNWGVTTPLWDFVFRTYCDKAPRPPSAARAP